MELSSPHFGVVNLVFGTLASAGVMAGTAYVFNFIHPGNAALFGGVAYLISAITKNKFQELFIDRGASPVKNRVLQIVHLSGSVILAAGISSLCGLSMPLLTAFEIVSLVLVVALISRLAMEIFRKPELLMNSPFSKLVMT